MTSSEGSAGANTRNRVLKLIATACVGSALFVAFGNNLSTRKEPVDYSKELPKAMPKGYGKFHQSGFGGIYNVGHPAGARARRHLTQASTIIPKSAVEHAIPSLSAENIENLHGHYFHDEHRSPFASFLYARPKDELKQEQDDYTAKMNKVREEWGSWNFVDSTTDIRPLANFDETPYRDMMNKDFPENSWQKDQKYVEDLIGEGRKLISRIREGIYAEYGHATKDLTEEEIEERNKLFEVHISDTKPATGMSYITEKGFQMLVRKLLHAMITNDEFYYIMGGHSAAAGHGNNFQQQYTMQFHKIMEPVFHHLGVRLISRNLAMGGLGTTHFSCGGATLYGEADFLTWDSGMTEKERGDIDLFHKQGLLGKERVPILFGGQVGDLEVETGGDLWYGDTLPNWDFFPLTTGLDQVDTLPYATRYMRCDKSVQSMCGSRGMDKYHDQCWEDRVDVEPQNRSPHVGGQASWHPGDREHQAKSRKRMVLFLKAFDAAFDMWEDGIKKDGFPLNESYWHVGEIYTQFQAKLSSYINNEGLGKTRCEQRWETIGLGKICRISMRGLTEWTPHNPAGNLIERIKAAPNGYKPFKHSPLYEGIDVIPQIQKIPDGEIDLHAIAIATAYAPPELDQSWVDDDDEDAEEAENSRRMLRRSVSRMTESVDETIVEDTTANETVDGGEEVTDEMESTEEPEEVEEDSNEEKIFPGIGWMLEDLRDHNPTGFCDGSAMSTCQRYPSNKCLLSGHNDNRSCIMGNALSGWLIVDIPMVKEGLIFAKLQWWSPRGDSHTLTNGWSEVNNGETFGNRVLKAPPIDWPQDTEVDIAINGKIYKTFNYDEFKPMTKEIAYNEAFYKFVDDETLAFNGGEPGPVEFGIRIRGTENPRNSAFGLSHLYYA